jgi:hypothetical protein
VDVDVDVDVDVGVDVDFDVDADVVCCRLMDSSDPAVPLFCFFFLNETNIRS